MKKHLLAGAAILALASTVQAADINFTGTDLAAAITAANPGDRILVNTNGPLTIEDVVIAKNLTIQGGVGFNPVIRIAVDSNANLQPGIRIDNVVVSLIDLDFVDLGNTTAITAIEVDNAVAVLNLTRCTIGDAAEHGVEVRDGATLNMQQSVIDASIEDGIRVTTAANLTVNQSTIDGGVRNIQFNTTDPANLLINVTLTNSRFLNSGEEGIFMDDNSVAGTSTGNVLIIDGCDILGSGIISDADAVLIDDGDVEFTTLQIKNNHINPASTGGAGIKLDNKWAELNSSTTLIDNNLVWFTGSNEQSGIQVERFSGNVQITNNTVYGFGEGAIVIDRADAAFPGTMTITGNLLIEWDETLYTVPGLNFGHGICDENAAGANITSNGNVLIDSSNSRFFVGVTPGGTDATGSNPLLHVVTLTPSSADFLKRIGTVGSTLSGPTRAEEWMQY
jgi:hypothetical protein